MIAFLDNFARRLKRFWYLRVTFPAMRKRMKSCGSGVSIGMQADITCERVSIGNNVYIGPRATIMSTRADVYISDNVMIGPNVTIITGDHRIDLIGRMMSTVKNAEKLPENDADVYLEEDIWIRANVTILKGVTIGTGSVVGAGSVVTTSIPPYSIAAGVPARVIRPRFSECDLKEHLERLSQSKNEVK